MLTPGGGASVIVSSYPASDLGEEGIIGLRYCGGGYGEGDRDSDVTRDSFSGTSSPGWEWFRVSGAFSAGICGDVAASPGGVSTVVWFC